MNDISIIIGIVSLFVIIGAVVPFIESEYSYDAGIDNPDDIGSIDSDVDSPSSVTIIDVFFSVLKMFFWSFGSLPLWLDLILTIFRVTLALAIARNVWVGGGG
jgi:hypothetical protein